jgi:predicted NAD/FAD-binding protein
MAVQSIGVVGGGIGGLGAAWLLDRGYRVTLLERNAYVGGHTNTLMVEDPRGAFPVDTGFMVFNDRNYPNLIKLFHHLGVASYPTCMSFAASLDGGRLEYAGTDLNGLFGQRTNLLKPGFLRMLADILRFNAAAKEFQARDSDSSLTLGDFLERGRYSEPFASHYLLPMAAAIWSCPTEQMRAFPFISFARFFNNHGLLDLHDRPQWRTVRGGSQIYVERMRSRMGAEVRTACRVQRVRRLSEGAEVRTEDGERLRFDALVLGCHGDEALGLIEQPTELERELLGAFRYQPNQVYLHSDPALMPRRRRVWSSWNYLRGTGEDPHAPVTVTYWMNRLQDLPTGRDIFVSLNPVRPPRDESVIAALTYDHPVFDARAIAAQQRMGEIQGRDRLWFAGAYLGYGFHEDGLRSALDVAAALGVSAPWVHSPAASPAVPGFTPELQPEAVGS